MQYAQNAVIDGRMVLQTDLDKLTDIARLLESISECGQVCCFEIFTTIYRM